MSKKFGGWCDFVKIYSEDQENNQTFTFTFLNVNRWWIDTLLVAVQALFSRCIAVHVDGAVIIHSTYIVQHYFPQIVVADCFAAVFKKKEKRVTGSCEIERRPSSRCSWPPQLARCRLYFCFI